MTFRDVVQISAVVVLLPVAAAAQTVRIPDTDTPPAARTTQLGDMIDRLEWKGLRPTVGTVVSGSGPAIGAEFTTTRMGSLPIGLGIDAAISIRNYQDLAIRIGALNTRNQRVRLNPHDNSLGSALRFPTIDAPGWGYYVEQRYRRLPSLSLYGATAPDEVVRTDFGQTVTATDVVFQWQTIRAVGVSARLGHVTVDPFAGTNDKLPNTETVFSGGITNALVTPSRYVVAGLGAGMDRRDHQWRPKRGSVVAITAWRFHSRSDAFASFSRLTVDAHTYRSVGTLRHIVAARVLGSYTGNPNGEMPFQHTQWLGGSDMLRSFRSYRFRGRSLSAATLESRWRTLRPLEVVLFVDVGHIGGPALPLGGKTTYTSVGVGARYWIKDRYALRMDIAKGYDGTRLVATFGAPF